MTDTINSYELEEQVVQQIRESRDRIDEELSKVIVGQKDVIRELLICLFAAGHCLITGAPGLAKTLLVRSIAQISRGSACGWFCASSSLPPASGAK